MAEFRYFGMDRVTGVHGTIFASGKEEATQKFRVKFPSSSADIWLRVVVQVEVLEGGNGYIVLTQDYTWTVKRKVLVSGSPRYLGHLRFDDLVDEDNTRLQDHFDTLVRHDRFQKLYAHKLIQSST